MKKLTGILLLFLVVFATSCDSETPEKARDYYKSIIDKINVLTGEYEADLIKSFDKFIPAEMDAKLTALKGYVKQLDEDFSKMEPFYGDASLLDGGIDVVDAYKEAIPLYEAVVKNESTPQSEYTEANSTIYKDLMKQINEKLNPVVDQNKVNSKVFGAMHKVKIIENSKVEAI